MSILCKVIGKLIYIMSSIVNFFSEVFKCGKVALSDGMEGSIKQCPICSKKFFYYRPYGQVLRLNAMCPRCKSVERHRAMWAIISEITNSNSGIRLLHFAPEKCFYEILKSKGNIDYYPVDFDPTYPGIRDVVDITKMQYEDGFFDVIICNHVLEHVSDDKTAMNELYRVLKKSGIALINVPIDNHFKKTFEESGLNTDELRTRYYGQHDHVRQYGLDFGTIIQRSGFLVNSVMPNKDLNDIEIRVKGLKRDEEVYICTKR